MSTTTSVLRLIFDTAGGKSFAITVPFPKDELTAPEVSAVMDIVLAKNIFITPSGELLYKRDAKAVGTTTTDLFDTPRV